MTAQIGCNRDNLGIVFPISQQNPMLQVFLFELPHLGSANRYLYHVFFDKK